MPDDQLWEQNDHEHQRIETRLDGLLNRLWWILGTLIPVMVLGAGVGIAVWADTQTLKRAEDDHATRAEVAEQLRERQRVDTQQTRALNWQTQAIEAIAQKVGAGGDLPSRPPMIEAEH